MVNEISNGLSNGKQSEAAESNVSVRVEVGMWEAESGGMHVTNGQIEHANQTLEQYIRIYCSYQQDYWDLLLPHC